MVFSFFLFFLTVMLSHRAPLFPIELKRFRQAMILKYIKKLSEEKLSTEVTPSKLVQFSR
jgi:hypothetical protein